MDIIFAVGLPSGTAASGICAVIAGLPSGTAASELGAAAEALRKLFAPLLNAFPRLAVTQLMNAVKPSIDYNDIRLNKCGECLNFSILGACQNKGCNFRHATTKCSEVKLAQTISLLTPAIKAFKADAAKAKKPKTTAGRPT